MESPQSVSLTTPFVSVAAEADDTHSSAALPPARVPLAAEITEAATSPNLIHSLGNTSTPAENSVTPTALHQQQRQQEQQQQPSKIAPQQHSAPSRMAGAAALSSESSRISQRLVEYFCVISIVPRHSSTDVPDGEGARDGNSDDISTKTPIDSRRYDSPLREASRPQTPTISRSMSSSSMASNGTSPNVRRKKRPSSQSYTAVMSHPPSPIPHRSTVTASPPSPIRPILQPQRSGPFTEQGARGSCTSTSAKEGLSRRGSLGNIHIQSPSSPNAASQYRRSLNESNGPVTSFDPVITARYPATDHADNPLNPMILYFCFPNNNAAPTATGECAAPSSSNSWSITPTEQYSMPRVHYFVLTLGCGRKLYGTCLTVLEEYQDSAALPTRSTKIQEGNGRDDSVEILKSATSEETLYNRHNSNTAGAATKVVYLPKVLLLLSTWPYLTAFREYLAQLYRLAVTTNVMTAPLERYIVNVCAEIPAPPPGAYEIQVPILNSVIRFWAPPAKLPIAYTALPYHILFECLDIDHVLQVWTALLLERKVLLVSSQCSILTVCAEIICSLLFPLRWSHLYVPLLPRLLCPMLDAPMPYLCGIVRDNWTFAQQFVGQGMEENETTLVVDLDCNTVDYHGGVAGSTSNGTAPGTGALRVSRSHSSDSHATETDGTTDETDPTVAAVAASATAVQRQDPWPMPPAKKWAKLHSSLTEAAGDVFWKARGMEEPYAQEMLKKPPKRSIDTLRRLAASMSSVESSGRIAHNSQWNEKMITMDHAFNLAYTPESPNLADGSSVNGHDEQSQWDRVQEAFLRFNVALLKDYRKYLTIPAPKPESSTHGRSTTEPSGATPPLLPSFDRVAFVAGLKADSVPFVSELCKAQQFDDFLSRRMYSPGEPDLVFFDQSIDAKLNRSKLKLKKVETPFLHAAKVHKQLTKLHAVAPNEEGLPFRSGSTKIPYLYEKFPETFDKNLLSVPRPIPKMISAEFDRQAIFVSKLRSAHVVKGEENTDDYTKGLYRESSHFYSGDFDTSPEVAAFTVFLFVYSSLVGRDWQTYSLKRREEDARNPPAATSENLAMDNSQNQSNAEERDAAASTETVENDSDTLNGRVAVGCCDDVCSTSGVTMITSTLSFLGTSAGEVYNSYFGKPVEVTLYTDLSFHEDKNVAIPTTDEAAAEYEEAREVAAAQLEMGLEVLATMTLRGLSVDSDAYLSLMEACGRCGDTKRAMKLIEMMKKDGFVADSDVVACFLTAFAHTAGLAVGNTPTEGRAEMEDIDAYSRLLSNGLDMAKEEKGCAATTGSWFYSPLSTLPRVTSPAVVVGPVEEDMDGSSDDGSVLSSTVPKKSVFHTEVKWKHLQQPLRPKKSKRRSKQGKKKPTQQAIAGAPLVTEMITRHLDLGESLLDFLYPNLEIDTQSDSCPHCSNRLDESSIVDGWKPCAFQDYTTQCPKCQHRFVPRFVVSCRSPDFVGSQGPQTPLYCEFLSPWVLRKEFHHIIKGDAPLDSDGIYKILHPSWRSGTDIRATLFWNLVVCCRRYRLPFTFLLQGSFSNRLILPRKPDEVE